jgi:hypothetical protein
VTPETDLEKIKCLVGLPTVSSKPLRPFDDLVCDFLHDLSNTLRNDPDVKKYPDVAAFSFWCRRANTLKIKEQFSSQSMRLGLGTAFHIAPSNVPINFAFSFAFGLLTGNANIVKVSSKQFPQTELVCGAIQKVLSEDKYSSIREMNSVIRYNNEDAITGYYSGLADVRVIWGGDHTIEHIKSFKSKLRARDVIFSDRYSICVLNSDEIEKLPSDDLLRLVERFYNDTYLMDQNACSSPQLVIWQGRKGSAGKALFWDALGQMVETKYDLQPIFSMDKFFQSCVDAVKLSSESSLKHYKNFVYRVQLNELKGAMEELRGSFGYFYEFDSNDLGSVLKHITNKVQTITYFGLDPKELGELVIKERVMGIDRIVPVGSALNISTTWDGYDLLHSLTRVIDIQ